MPQSCPPTVFDSHTLAQLQELIDGDDTSFLLELFASYVETAQANLTTLRSATSPDELRRAAHTLKGSSLNVGAARVASICLQVEHCLQADWAPSAAREALTPSVVALEHQLRRVAESYPQAISELARRASA